MNEKFIKREDSKKESHPTITITHPYGNVVLHDAIVKFLDMYPDNTPLHIVMK